MINDVSEYFKINILVIQIALSTEQYVKIFLALY